MKKIKVLGLLMMLAAVSMVGCGKEPEYVPGGGFTDAVYDEVVEEIEEVDPFAIPEVIEGKVPTNNEAYLAFDSAGLVSDDEFILDIDKVSDKTFTKYSSEDWGELEVIYTKFDSVEYAKSKMDIWSTQGMENNSEPDISKETHYCYEEVSHEMKNSCEIRTIKKTLHDKYCNAAVDEYMPTYIIEKYIYKGEGLLQLIYSTDENGNPLCADKYNAAVQIYKDLEFITFE